MSDLIDRQAAIEEVARRDTTDGTVKVFSGREIIEILNGLPSVQPERQWETCFDCPLSQSDLICMRFAHSFRSADKIVQYLYDLG